MKLDFIEMAGFRGFREKTRISFPMGFAVLSGHNGTGKSTVFDAVDYALTGTINKFSVKGTKGGGLDEHIWWVGSGKPEGHYVSVGFIDDDDQRFVVTRSHESGSVTQASEIVERLCLDQSPHATSVESLLQTTLIRDEWIAGLSLDLPKEARFALVREAIGNLVGPDYSKRTEAISSAAGAAKNRQEDRIRELQGELGRALGDLTEARSVAARSADLSEALKVIESVAIPLPANPVERVAAIQRLIAERRVRLQQLDRLLAQVKEVERENAFFVSASGRTQFEEARIEQARSEEARKHASERLALATKADLSETESDQFAAHISAILEHGEDVGLQAGHCPLCDAARTQQEFTQAIAAARARLAERGKRLAATASALSNAKAELERTEQGLAVANRRYTELEQRRQGLDSRLLTIKDAYSRLGFKDAPANAKSAEDLIFREQTSLVQLERAFAMLETSNAMDRVKALETKVAQLRERADQEAARLIAIERAVEAARQIEAAAKTVANEILVEQFDTVMPLLKELYRRLRPHADWTEIESDFGGKVRGSLNFVVGDGHNPQFLFSSGQRRAAGLAFLLAVHLSRPWCRWRSLLLDDPVQHIDDYRALNLVEVLAAIRRTNRQVIVAVEDPALADLLCRRLRSDSDGIGRIIEFRTSSTGSAEIASSRDIYPMPKLVLRGAQAS